MGLQVVWSPAYPPNAIWLCDSSIFCGDIGYRVLKSWLRWANVRRIPRKAKKRLKKLPAVAMFKISLPIFEMSTPRRCSNLFEMWGEYQRRHSREYGFFL